MALFSPLRGIKADPDQLAAEAGKHLERAAYHERYDEFVAMTAHATVAVAKVQLAAYLRAHR